MIEPEAGLSISRQCALLGVARSSFYYRPRPESAEEFELLKRLDRIFTDHPVYGSRRLQVALRREGISVGRRRVRRLMQKLGFGQSARSGTPAGGIPGTRSIRTFCVAKRSTTRTKCGQLT
jgi:putative transposase